MALLLLYVAGFNSVLRLSKLEQQWPRRAVSVPRREKKPGGGEKTCPQSKCDVRRSRLEVLDGQVVFSLWLLF